MSLIRWSSGQELPAFPSDILNIQREINRMFNSFFHSGWLEDSSLAPTQWSPATDVVEREDAFEVKVELPGVPKDSVKITMENSILTVSGEKKDERQSTKGNMHRVERAYGAFQRSFTLPSTIKADAVEASFKDGILTVTLPKAENVRPKEIEVTVK